MTETCGWRRACLYSVFFHLAALICFGLLFNGYTSRHPEIAHVIDLDIVDYEQGSGHAGGGIPEAAIPAPVTATPAQETAAPAEDNIAVPVSAPAVPAAASSEKSTGGSGSVPGNTPGSGSGSETGDGRGSGAGRGQGEGTGSSGTPGRGSGQFDLAGFANAVDARKQYPYMAVKRKIQGAVTVAVTLDAEGKLVAASTVSATAPMLEQAAQQAIRAACPYPNALRAPVSFTTTIHFVLN